MNFTFYIAKRYLFSKKSTNVINLISTITIVGVAVCTMALIVILSVFDGLESFVTARFNSFDPDLKITSATGKSFDIEQDEIYKLREYKKIIYYAEVVEENALIKYGDLYHPFVLKGVDNDFEKMTGIDTMMIDGTFKIHYDSIPVSVIGSGVAGFLSINLNSMRPIKVYMPKRTGKTGSIVTDPANAFKVKTIIPLGVFSIDQEIDDYIIVPIKFARELMDYNNRATAIELHINPDIDIKQIKNEIRTILGDKYLVKDRFEQKEYIYKIMKSEKLIIYFILTFILIIATFNLIGSLTMLIIDKKEDIITLRSLGANMKMIRKIFWIEGWMISFIGTFIGISLGALLCWLQIEFEFVKLQGDASRLFITAYPVELSTMNFVYVVTTVLFIGFMVSWIPMRLITRKYLMIR